jgi:DNA-binding NarL/FixJ family response regulator
MIVRFNEYDDVLSSKDYFQSLNEDIKGTLSSKDVLINFDLSPEEVMESIQKVTAELKLDSAVATSIIENVAKGVIGKKNAKEIKDVVKKVLDNEGVPVEMQRLAGHLVNTLAANKIVMTDAVSSLLRNANGEIKRALRNVTNNKVLHDQLAILKNKKIEYAKSSLPDKDKLVKDVDSLIASLSGQLESFERSIAKYQKILKGDKKISDAAAEKDKKEMTPQDKDKIKTFKENIRGHNEKKALLSDRFRLKRKAITKDGENDVEVVQITLADLTLTNLCVRYSKCRGVLNMNDNNLKRSTAARNKAKKAEWTERIFKEAVSKKRDDITMEVAAKIVEKSVKEGKIKLQTLMTPFEQLLSYRELISKNSPDVSAEEKNAYLQYQEILMIFTKMLNLNSIPDPKKRSEVLVNITNLPVKKIKEMLTKYVMVDVDQITDMKDKAMYIYQSLKIWEYEYGITIDFTWMDKPEMSKEAAFKSRRFPNKQAIETLLKDIDINISIEKDKMRSVATGRDGDNVVDIAIKLYGKKLTKASPETGVTRQILEYDPVKVKNLIVMAHINVVIALARQYCLRYGTLHLLNDAVGFGTVGLTLAVDAWQTAQQSRNYNVPIDSYIKSRVMMEIKAGMSEMTSGGVVKYGAKYNKNAREKDLIMEFKLQHPNIESFINTDDLQKIYSSSITIATESQLNTNTEGDEMSVFDTIVAGAAGGEISSAEDMPTEMEVDYLFGKLDEWVKSGKSGRGINTEKKRAFVKLFIAGLTQDEIADALQLSQSTVSVHCASLTEMLKKLFSRMGGKTKATRTLTMIGNWFKTLGEMKEIDMYITKAHGLQYPQQDDNDNVGEEETIGGNNDDDDDNDEGDSNINDALNI